MSASLSGWAFPLLFSGMTIILGIAGVFAARQNSDRSRARGTFLQGCILALVAGTAYRLPNLDLRLAAAVVTGLLIIQQSGLLEVDTETNPGESKPN